MGDAAQLGCYETVLIPRRVGCASVDVATLIPMFPYQYPRAANTASVIAWCNHAGGQSILGIVRGKEPYKGMLALPGGFHNPDKETLEQTACRELMEETALDVHSDLLRLVCVQSSPTRDPREHVIDHVYSVMVGYHILERAQPGDDAAEIKIVDARSSSIWAFDHADSINRFLSQLR